VRERGEGGLLCVGLKIDWLGNLVVQQVLRLG
jgi:hypothetical protein